MKLPASSIELFNDTGASLPVDSSTFQALAKLVEEGEDCSFQLLEAVAVTETRIREINREYLDHDYVTDIITFRYDENKGFSRIEGTLYCCWSRISEQAKDYNETPGREFHRVLLHGLLHLAGYRDQTEEDQSTMRRQENYYLDKLNER